MFFINLGLILLSVFLIICVNYGIYLVFEDENTLFKIFVHIMGNISILSIILLGIGFYTM